METFRSLLFGFAGVSVVFWVSIIALWHAYMFPRFFNEDKGLNSIINEEIYYPKKPILGSPNGVNLNTSHLPNQKTVNIHANTIGVMTSTTLKSISIKVINLVIIVPFLNK